MKSYHLFSKSIAGILALACVFSGCTDEETSDGPKVPLSISASFPAYTGISTRAGSPTVRIALNTDAGVYDASGKTYQVTSTSPITFTPDDPGDALKILGSATSTPLTLYGWLDENTPVCYSNNAIAVSHGNITSVSLSPAYACIGVRIKKNGQTEATGSYTIGSNLAGTGTYSTNNNWNTEQSTPKLTGFSVPSNIKNTDKTTVIGASPTDITSEYFMRVVPQDVTANFENLFSITLPDGTTLKVPSGTNSLSIESGHCYLFTVNISREATLTVEGVETTLMNKRVNITAISERYNGMRGIFSVEDLKAFRDAANNGDDLSKWGESGIVNLYMDIDLENEEWIPIRSFDGTFNGNGHMISNLYIPATYYDEQDVGFFCNANDNSIIKGLTINGAAIGGNKHRYVGVIAGSSTGAIIDCHVKGRIQIESGSAAGGIAGIFAGVNKKRPFTQIIAACTVETDENSFIKSSTIGGIVGYWDKSFIVGCIAHDITFDTETELQDNTKSGICGEVRNDAALLVSNIAYNCKGAQSRMSTAGITGVSSRGESCYFYNVFNITPDGEWYIHSDGYQPSLEALSESTIIDEMNRNLFLEDFEYYYEASPSPTVTGPTIHIGTKP